MILQYYISGATFTWATIAQCFQDCIQRYKSRDMSVITAVEPDIFNKGLILGKVPEIT